MTFRNTGDDLLHPERVLFRLLQDYANGLLQNRPNSSFFRARVEAVDHEGGQLESTPPNPPNSVRARIYTSGMDFNLPSDVLTIFYPLGNLRPVMAGEHVIVTFEDVHQTSGYWMGVLPQRYDVNYTNPDDSQTREGDTSHAFEGDDPQQRTPNPTLQYGGLVGGATTTRSRIVEAFRSSADHWSGQKVLAIGDSQMESSFGIRLGSVLREHGVSEFVRDGRHGWSIYAWLNGRLHSSDSLEATLDVLMARHSPDIVIISLGGNDGSSGFARRSDFEQKVQQLWRIAQTAPRFAVWCGPPTAVGRGATHQPGRDLANDRIRNVVGSANFIDVRTVTNTTDGRTSDGVHFTSTSSALTPWVQMVVDRGNIL